jgi:hypothetical protein
MTKLIIQSIFDRAGKPKCRTQSKQLRRHKKILSVRAPIYMPCASRFGGSYMSVSFAILAKRRCFFGPSAKGLHSHRSLNLLWRNKLTLLRAIVGAFLFRKASLKGKWLSSPTSSLPMGKPFVFVYFLYPLLVLLLRGMPPCLLIPLIPIMIYKVNFTSISFLGNLN